jgi:dihydroorotate dehydrogenase electron transfer subunit
MSIYQGKAKIVKQQKVGETFYHLCVESAAVAKFAVPGQFAMLKVAAGDEPLLRRPISIHSVSGKTVEFLYDVVGKGTEILSGARVGESIDIIGPLGAGFSLVPGPAIVVAGGIGVAPLFFLAQKLVKMKKTVTVLIGGRTKTHVLCAKDFKALGCVVKIATDDGSGGHHGRVTELLEVVLSKPSAMSHEPRAIYACGPHPMLKALAQVAQRKGVSAQVSLETHMACGIGACLGCVVNTVSGFKRVCKEGPVFGAREIIW